MVISKTFKKLHCFRKFLKISAIWGFDDPIKASHFLGAIITKAKYLAG